MPWGQFLTIIAQIFIIVIVGFVIAAIVSTVYDNVKGKK